MMGAIYQILQKKKYQKCEQERIKKAEEKAITYLYDLFYELEKK